MNFIFAIMMCYWTIKNTEEHFANKHAEMATLMLFNAVACLAFGTLAGEYMVMHNPYIFSLMYVWCKFNPEGMMSIWGFPVKTGNLPWVLIAFHVLTGNSPIADLVGLAAGHTYIYLKMILPNSHGYDLIKTPSWIESMTDKLYVWGHGGRPQRGFGINRN